MKTSIATANFYWLPFRQTLEIIAQAGFEYIELDLPWERGPWAVAQHLKGVQAREVVDLIKQYGLKVSSIHDAGGVIADAHSIRGFVDPQLKEYLDQLGYAPGCIVFHIPHIEGPYDQRWWRSIADEIIIAADRYRGSETIVTLENMPLFAGYYVPLTTPQELLAFVAPTELGITLDTTHYAQIGVDVAHAANILHKKIRTIHLSDFAAGQAHVFIGDGELDFAGLFQRFDLSTLHSITLECTPGFLGENPFELSSAKMVERLKIAQSRLHGWLKEA